MLFTALLALASCTLEEMETVYIDPNAESFDITVGVDDPEAIGPHTKSSFTDADLSRISDMNILIYHEGVFLKDYSKYITDLSSIKLTLPGGKDGFNIYLVGNVGEVDAPESESDIDELQYVVSSYNDFRSKGFPVANVYRNYAKGSQTNLKVKRLVGQYNVRIDASATSAKYTVKDLRMVNCALDVYPFATDKKATMFTQIDNTKTGDILTEKDIEMLNAGETVSLYFIENLQGVLLPGNTDRRNKIPSILGEEYASCCTYIEITADIQTLSANYTNGKYRYYLGQDETTDFSIKRNTVYNAALDFTQNMVSEEEWRIEVDQPEFVGVRFDKEEAMVIKGAEDMIYIQAFDNQGNLMDFNVEVIQNKSYINVEKVNNLYFREHSELGRCFGLRFTSNLGLDGMYPFDEEPTYKSSRIRISSKETYNGKPIFVKEIPVRVYHKLFPLLLKIEEEQSGQVLSNSVKMYGQNPMGLGLKVNVDVWDSAWRESTGEGEAVNYVISNGKTIHKAVNREGVKVIDRTITGLLPNAKMIEFTIKGVTGSYGQTNGRGIAYPKLLESEYIYMGGAECEATYGPGDFLYPKNFMPYTDDYAYCAEINGKESGLGNDTGDPVGYIGNGKKIWTNVYVYATTFYQPEFHHYYFFRTGEIDAYYKEPNSTYVGINQPSIAGKMADYGVNKGNYNLFTEREKITAPFYFVNGGQTSYYFYAYDTNELKNWNNKHEKLKIEIKFYGPGRDLFEENNINNDSTKEVYKTHTMKFSITAWHNIVGNPKSTLKENSYEGNAYMTINGCSSWPGADETVNGFYPDLN